MSSYTIPYVTEKRPGGERSLDIFSRLLSDRIVYLNTPIDDGVAGVLIAQLLHLESDAPETPIEMYLNSPGGDISATLAVYDTLQYISSPVSTTCVGQASWSAAVLLAGGEPGRRSVLPHSKAVLHQPVAQQKGTIPDLILAADEVLRTRTQLEEILARHTNKTAEQVRSDTDRELVLPAQAACDYGLADNIISNRAPARVM